MKALVLTEKDVIGVQDVPVPEPETGEVRVRVHYTGVCGSDVPRVLEGRVHSFPLVLGHEFSGVVDAVGEGVDPALVGSRVAGVPLVPCMGCEECAAGHYSQCERYGFIGSRQPGSMAQLVCVPRENVVVIDDAITDLQAAFFEPATVGMHAVRLAGFAAPANALVIGAGTIGLLLAQELVALGASPLVISNRSQHRLQTARLFEGMTPICSAEGGWCKEALDLIAARGFDYVFDTAANSPTIADALALAKPHGTVCFVGTPKKDVSLTIGAWEAINRKELTVTGSWMSYSAPWPGSEWSDVAALFANGALTVPDQMVDAVYRLGEGRTAFDRFKDAANVNGKILIDSSEE